MGLLGFTVENEGENAESRELIDLASSPAQSDSPFMICGRLLPGTRVPSKWALLPGSDSRMPGRRHADLGNTRSISPARRARTRSSSGLSTALTIERSPSCRSPGRAAQEVTIGGPSLSTKRLRARFLRVPFTRVHRGRSEAFSETGVTPSPLLLELFKILAQTHRPARELSARVPTPERQCSPLR